MIRAVTDQMKGQQMGPREIIAMTKDMNDVSGAGQMMKAMNEIIVPTMKSMMQLGRDNAPQGESPVVTILGEVIEKGTAIAKQALETRRDTAVGEARVKAAEAAARVAEARGLPQGAPPPVQGTQVNAPPAAPAVGAAGTEPDAETFRLFGEISDSIMRLRLGVKSGQVKPGHVFVGLGNVIATVKERGYKVPALHLLEQQQVPEFVDKLVPEATQEWKRELMRWIYKGGDPGPAPVTEPEGKVIPLKKGEPEGEPLPDDAPCARCSHRNDGHADDDVGKCEVEGCQCPGFEEKPGDAA